jgi:uncharacterized protein
MSKVALRFLVEGQVEGEQLVLQAPLSFWGGYDPETGTIIDQSHPDVGVSCAGKVLLMRETKGSSSASSVLAEAIRRGTAPRAIILEKPCGILTVGALVARALYGKTCAIAVDEPIKP